MKFVFAIVALFIAQVCFGQDGSLPSDISLADTIKEARMTFRLPNDKWSLADSGGESLKRYIYNREAILDSLGRSFVPGIVIAVEDAKNYGGDLVLYSTSVRMGMSNSLTINIKEVLSWETKDWPLPYKNAVFYIAGYTEEGIDHLLYMIHIINKWNKGIQIYMDMPESLASQYEHEFVEFLKSVKEVGGKTTAKPMAKKRGK